MQKESMAGINEQRKFTRINRSASIKHVKFHLGSDLKVPLRSLSKDISAGGILFDSAQFYDIGDIVRLEIDLPGWEKFKPEFYKPPLGKSEPVIALVKVIRVFLKGVGAYEIGASFVGIDDGHQMALTKYIKQQKLR